MNSERMSKIINPFTIIIFTAILMQLLGRYYSSRVLVLGNYFQALWVVLRIIIPIVVLYALKIPLSELGIGLPQIDKKFLKILISLIVIVVIVFVGIYFYKGYFQSYSGQFQAGNFSKLGRVKNFMIFTSSTLIGWEFIHRCFLLMGLIYFLKARDKVDFDTSVKIAICIVWIFEVVFHFIKPKLEAFGLLAGSPILSYVAVRTKSIWIPLIAHFIVEVLFIYALVMQ